MKLSGGAAKWVTGAVGAVLVVVLANFLLQVSGVWPGYRHASASAIAAKGRLDRGSSRGDDLGLYNPIVRLDRLKQLLDRPLPELTRNPFEFEAAPARPSPAHSASAPPPTQPPAPPVSLKIMGYSEKAGGVQEALASDDEQVYVIHEGDTVAGKYKILKITPKTVTVENVSSHQIADLPIPQ